MKIPDFTLLDRLLNGKKRAKYDLASSEIKGVLLDDLLDYSDLDQPPSFDLGKNDHFGHTGLKEVLGDMYGCGPDNLVTTTGGSEANFLVFLGHVKNGDRVIVESPGYEPMMKVPEMLGAEVVSWPRTYENSFGLDPEILEDILDDNTSLVVMTDLHNPSGVSASKSDIRSAADKAGEYGAKLLVDEIFLDGCREEKGSASDLKNVIVTSSMTKIYGLGGLRTGWIVSSRDSARKCQRAKAMVSGASPYLSEHLSAAALLRAGNKLLTRFGEIAGRNMGIVSRWVEKEPSLEWVEPEGGVMCFPKFDLPTDSTTLCERALGEEGVLISPGSCFGLEGHFRLACVFDDAPKLEVGLSALGRVLDAV